MMSIKEVNEWSILYNQEITLLSKPKHRSKGKAGYMITGKPLRGDA